MNNEEEIPPPPRTPQPCGLGRRTSTPEKQYAAVKLVLERLQPALPETPDRRPGPPERDLRQVPSFYIPNNP